MVGSASGRPGKWQATAVGLVGLSVLLAGCGSVRDLACPGFVLPRPASEYDFAPFASEPRARLGGTPYMGYYTLFAMADPDRLGQHSYQGVWTPGETSRGTLYTARAGFIDVAHMRKSIDWTAFHYVRIRTAIDEGWPCIKLPSKEPSVYFLNFKYPAFWDEMGAEERASLAHELAIRLAVELSHVQLTWHEIATWFGYRSTPLSEKPSAFTYEDPVSHLLGGRIAAEALSERNSDFNEAVTRHLADTLKEIEVVPEDKAYEAIRLVQDKWWNQRAGGRPMKRQVDFGLDDGVIKPWLVLDLPGYAKRQAVPLRLPEIDRIDGRDLRGFCLIECEPNMGIWSRLRNKLPGDPKRLRPKEHFPVLERLIRQEVIAADGPAAVEPY